MNTPAPGTIPANVKSHKDISTGTLIQLLRDQGLTIATGAREGGAKGGRLIPNGDAHLDRVGDRLWFIHALPEDPADVTARIEAAVINLARLRGVNIRIHENGVQIATYGSAL